MIEQLDDFVCDIQCEEYYAYLEYCEGELNEYESEEEGLDDYEDEAEDC